MPSNLAILWRRGTDVHLKVTRDVLSKVTSARAAIVLPAPATFHEVELECIVILVVVVVAVVAAAAAAAAGGGGRRR